MPAFLPIAIGFLGASSPFSKVTSSLARCQHTYKSIVKKSRATLLDRKCFWENLIVLIFKMTEYLEEAGRGAFLFASFWW